MSERKKPENRFSNRFSEMFGQIAEEYEFFNKIISFGQINRWRRKSVRIINPPKYGRVLDICCGPGNLTREIASYMPEGEVIGLDFSAGMIKRARSLTAEEGLENVEFRTGDAADLDFASEQFDVVTVAFGLRNIVRMEEAIDEMLRVLKPGGKAASLDLGKPRNKLFRRLYGFYFHRIMPRLAGFILEDKKPYKYLSSSLKSFPDQESLREIFASRGFQDVHYREFLNGVTVLHIGQKKLCLKNSIL